MILKNSKPLMTETFQVRGTVQGVGFRPFVYRLAQKLYLSGWVRNTVQGVRIEVTGLPQQIKQFRQKLFSDAPFAANIREISKIKSIRKKKHSSGFRILESDNTQHITALISPDLSLCPECLHEMLNPSNRRYRYPFINCTNCGPRFSIITDLPYDRTNTTMKSFKMCTRCQTEYKDPMNRRFHAEPNACPVCGPHLELWNRDGKKICTHDDAILETARVIAQGQIVAVKGLGGFHLMIDAGNDQAVCELRRKKGHEEKPFALMCPSLKWIRKYCHVSSLEQSILRSAQSPIVLLHRKKGSCEGISRYIAPRNPYLGMMLPYTPLHHLLMAEINFPVVATSGNVADEPICIDEQDALKRLGTIADLFLVHNRPIQRHVDDSIVRITAGRELVLRRSRGYAPLPIELPKKIPPVISVGAHLKNTIAISVDNQVFISQHIGDLENVQAMKAFKEVIESLQNVYHYRPQRMACDVHPDYESTHYAEKSKIPLIKVQHHYAHVLSCMAENKLTGRCLGVSWDGTGYGPDGTVWGGEFFLVKGNRYQRFGHFRTFGLPGGDLAVHEPRRSALGLLYEIFGPKFFKMNHLAPIKAFTTKERRVLSRLFEKNFNIPKTSSVGRLFDAAASILNTRQLIKFEGQAAMELEFKTDAVRLNSVYPRKIHQTPGFPFVVDWEPMILAILKDLRLKISLEKISIKLHNTLAEIVVDMAKMSGERNIVLTGGCFQNRYLTERTIHRLRSEKLIPYWHRQIPPNDGGISLGQIVAASQTPLRTQTH